MNIFNNELLENKEQSTILLDNIKNSIRLNLNFQSQYKKTLVKYIQKISNCPNDYLESNYMSSFFKLLKNLEKNLKLYNNNIAKLNSMQDALNNLYNSSNNEIISNFYISYEKIQNEILENNIQIEEFFDMSLDLFNLSFLSDITGATDTKEKLESNEPKSNDDISNNLIKSNNINTQNNLDNTNTQSSIIDGEKNINTNTYSNSLEENTLIISEMRGKVILPYTIFKLETILKNKPEKYSSIQDVIDKDYTLPFNYYRNPALSRFKEAFKLMRNKEISSIIEAFDLSMELLVNYNLHPAIITACKNLDELDIYLDCLENNETDKFKCFNIKFEIAPMIVKNK